MSEHEPAYVGLGSNLDGPVERVRAGAEALGRLPATRLVARSRLYGSAPMGPSDQPDYVNAVARLETSLEPHALLDALQAIEAEAGRDRSVGRWGPRTLDLDLLTLGEHRCADERLTLPHPGIADRPFVLVPLAELAPGLKPPGWSETVAVRAARADRSGIWSLETDS